MEKEDKQGVGIYDYMGRQCRLEDFVGPVNFLQGSCLMEGSTGPGDKADRAVDETTPATDE